MAYTKKTTNSTDTETIVSETKTTNDTEKSEMQARIDKLESMLSAMMAMNNNNNSNVQVIDTTSKMDRPCTLVHLLECTPGLPTSIIVNGNIHYFQNFGEKKTFRFSDMQVIATTYRDWFDRGVFTLGEDCSEYESDFGIHIMKNNIPVEIYNKIAELNVNDFKSLIQSINESQRVLLAKTWAQRYYNKVKGYNDVNKLRVLNKATNGMLKEILAEIVDDED